MWLENPAMARDSTGIGGARGSTELENGMHTQTVEVVPPSKPNTTLLSLSMPCISNSHISPFLFLFFIISALLCFGFWWVFNTNRVRVRVRVRERQGVEVRIWKMTLFLVRETDGVWIRKYITTILIYLRFWIRKYITLFYL